ncbi:OmpW/AlkL family protein [Solimonas terrae]|uniref:Outer membrane beta-barrel protein n=1 Tax=Solimonas terrae TaxID=1396819 RepID=A0A6M2BLZ9_9GAMM|nr:OmpW family outer membrane protein [Solimonas terrae]NGY03185.1 outer membrane beta-barrel protein [Solimonas terrae]
MNKINKGISWAFAAAVGLGHAGLAPAYDSGDWIVRGGSHYIDPKHHNHDVVKVDGAFGVTGSVEYFATPSLAVDLLLAVPYRHDIELVNGGDKVASTRHLPPTLSLVWYPAVSESWHPFVGAGVNYTMFFDEKTHGALDGSKLSLKDSVGVAAVGGLALDLNKAWSVVADLRYFKIDTKARLDGTSIGTVKIDPMGYGLSIGYRF